MSYYRDDYPIIEQALECYLTKIQADDSIDNDYINQVKQLIHRTQDRMQRLQIGVVNHAIYPFDFRRY